MPARHIVSRSTKAEGEGALGVMSFENAVIKDLVAECGYPYDTDKSDILNQMYTDKKRHMLASRDRRYTSKYTGVTAAPPKVTYMQVRTRGARNQGPAQIRLSDPVQKSDLEIPKSQIIFGRIFLLLTRCKF